MTTVNTGARRWNWKHGLFLLLALVAGWAIYGMFQPVLTWSSGWTPLPVAEGGSAPATHESTQDWEAVASQATAQLQAAHSRLQAPALSAAIMIDGQRVWAAAVGKADLAQSRPATLDTSFRIGSSSKAINALALGRLLDAGKIDIDRPVRAYLPDLPAHYEAVSTRQAISHLAGIPDYGLCLCFPIWEHRNRRHFASVRDALRVFEHRPLLSTPGQAFRYSSYSANLAGAVMAAAAATPYLDLLRNSVFTPLGMARSRGDEVSVDDPQRVTFYEVTEGQYKVAEAVDNSIRYPSGGLLSTPSDMLAVGQAFISDSLLSSAVREQLLTPQRLADGSDNGQGYALGIRVFEDKTLLDESIRTRFYSHHGTAIGSTSYFAIYPEYGLVVSVMMNKGQDNLDALAPEANRLVELFIAEIIQRRH